MSKTSAFLLAALALIIGAFAGAWGVAQFYGRFTGNLTSTSLAAEAGTTARILERLRAGNATAAVELLELKLDGAVIGLGAFLAETPASRRDPSHLKMLQIARDYRIKFPRKTNSPEIDDGVARAFGLLDGQTRH